MNFTTTRTTFFGASLGILALFCLVQPAMASTRPLPQDAERQMRETMLKRFVSPTAPQVATRKARTRMDEGNLVGDHLVFENQKAAADWMRAKEKEMQAAFGASKFEVVDNHPYQAVIQQYVDELWVGTAALFPEETQGLSTPPVVIIDAGKESNAFIADGGEYVPHAVYVLTGLVDEAGGIDQKEGLTGILAHEIGHSVFLHGLSGNSEKIVRFYERDANKLAFESKTNHRLQQRMQSYLAAARTAGDLSNPQLFSLPSPGYGSPLMTRIWGQLRKELVTDSTECRAEKASLDRWQRLVPFSTLNLAYEVPAPDRLQLASPLLINKGKDCFGPRQVSLAALMAKTLGVSEADLAGSPDFQRFNNVYQHSSDPISGLQAMVNLDREVMQDIERSVDVAHLGYYTTEQHADDISALVHAYLGRNPASFSTLLARMMENIRPGDLATCNSMIDNNQMPAMGSFQVIHHSYCYRIHHFGLMKKRLAQVTDLKAFTKDFLRQSQSAGNE